MEANEIFQIANHFGISIDMMVKKDITVNDILHFNVEQLLSTPNPKSNASNEISLINSKILDAFFENPTNKALFASCEKIQIPIFRSKPLIAFHSDCFSDIQKQNFPATEFIFICSEKQDIQTVSYQKFVYFLSHQRQLCFSDSLDSAAVCIWQIEFILAPFNSYYSSIFEKIEQINSKLDKFSLD